MRNAKCDAKCEIHEASDRALYKDIMYPIVHHSNSTTGYAATHNCQAVQAFPAIHKYIHTITHHVQLSHQLPAIPG